MMNIILVRHGETAWNRGVIFRGRKDIPLNDVGFNQAKRVAKRLEEFKIKKVITSPLKRSVATAEVIAKMHHIDCEVNSNLIDISCGKWEGVSLKEVETKYPREISIWKEKPHEFTMPGGESLNDVRIRIVKLLNDLYKQTNVGDIVIVSHRVVLKVMICALLDLDNSHFWNIKMDNCAITIFQFNEGRTVLVLHNDTCHLSGLEILSDF